MNLPVSTVRLLIIGLLAMLLLGQVSVSVLAWQGTSVPTDMSSLMHTAMGGLIGLLINPNGESEKGKTL